MLRKALLFFLTVCGVSVADELVVSVAVNQRAPVYLHPFINAQSGFEERYLKELESVLRFDLDQSGRMHTLPCEARYSTQIAAEKELRNFDLSAWKRLNVSFIIKASLNQKKLTLAALNVQKGVVKGIESIVLTGKLAEDRVTIHKIADAMHEAFFGEPGIAQSHILYTVLSKNQNDPTKWITEIWQCDYDGQNARQITHDHSLNITPTYIPPEKGMRSRHFLYVSYKMGQPKIFSASIADGIGKRLVSLRGDQLTPSISFQKDKIAFISDATGNPDLFVQNFSAKDGVLGKPQCVFSSREGAQGSPVFNHDGTKLAFVSNKDGNPRIYFLNLSSPKTPPVMITKRNMENTCPAWSPDGSKIAYSAMTKGVRQIWIYDLEREKEIQLTETSGNKENPSWAPDSKHIVYNSSLSNSAELYLIDILHKEPQVITQGPGEKRFPSWEPYFVMTKPYSREKKI